MSADNCLSAANLLDRRSFVAACAAAAAGLASAGCAPETQLSSTDGSENELWQRDADLDEKTAGKWITVSCNNNCGGMCVNRAYVVDGMVMRMKTDDTTEENDRVFQMRGCPRGRAKRWDTFGPDRLKYPMKRKHWEPHTGGRKELRGLDEWERISWDEAFDIVSDELRYAIDHYSNRSILMSGLTFASGFPRLFNSLGGAVMATSTYSFGTGYFNAAVIGQPSVGLGEDNDRLDWVNADAIVLYGCNPAWSSGGSYTYCFNEAKKAGVQFVFVGPEYNFSAALFNAKWIQVRPGTDTAFLLAVAYEMFKADEEAPGSVVDWDFVHRYAVGVDAESMPEDATIDENFKDYVLGRYDGEPKTAEWASAICGTAVEDIRWYANLMGRDNAVMVMRSFAALRTNDSDNFSQAYMAVGILGGHMGKSGHMTGTAYHACVGSPICDPIYSPGATGLSDIPPVLDDVMNGCEQWEAVLQGSYNAVGNIQADQLLPAERRDIDIHVICHSESAALQTHLDSNKGIEAHRKVDFVFATARNLTSQARYADVVLPLCSEWELVGTCRNAYNPYLHNREVFIAAQQVCEPLYESKSEQQIIEGLAEKMGLDPRAVYDVTEKQQLFNILKGSTLKNEKGEQENLLAITEEEIAELGVEGEPQQGRVSFSEFIEKGFDRVDRSPNDVYTYYGYQDFIADPETNPRNTASGKFEIYCQAKADGLNGANWTEEGFVWKPYPTYKAPVNGYEESFEDYEAEIKGEYPYQVFNPHYLRRAHTQFDNVPWLRQAFAQPFFVSVADAAEKGISDGDTVRVWSATGEILRQASVSERLMPGVVALPHGAWIEIDPETGIDHAGCDNILTSAVTSGCGVSGYNTNLVNFEKYTGEALEPDYTWPQRIIFE